MRRSAKSVRGGTEPNSLMARLAQLQTGGPQPTIRTRPRAVQRYFGLGLLGGGLIGCVAIVALPHVTAEQARDFTVQAPAANAAAPWRPAAASQSPESLTRAAPVAPASPRTAAVDPPGPPPPLNMNLTRSGRGAVPFPLQVTGVADPDNARLILRDMPATARLTSGERRDENTWALRLGELPDLQVNLGAGTPEIFDITIEIASTSGAQILTTSARVRLKPGDAPTGPRRLPTSIEDLLRESKAIVPPPTPAAVETPFHTEVIGAPATEAPADPVKAPVTQAAADAGTPPTQAADASAPSITQTAETTERKALLEGLSALGGPVTRPESESQTESRQVWWKLPAPAPTPAWAPFGNSAKR